jgi:hypothetical protein
LPHCLWIMVKKWLNEARLDVRPILKVNVGGMTKSKEKTK